jgi:hypothetical protein
MPRRRAPPPTDCALASPAPRSSTAPGARPRPWPKRGRSSSRPTRSARRRSRSTRASPSAASPSPASSRPRPLEPLRSAESRAFSVGAIGPGIEAAARRIYVEAVLDQPGPALARAELLEPLAAGLRGDRFSRPLLLNNLGTVHLVKGDRERARQLFARARDVRATVAEPAFELLVIDRNLALVSSPTDAAQLGRAAWHALEARVGPAHAASLDAMNVAGHLVGDPAEALAIVRGFVERAERFHPDAPAMRADALSFIGFLVAEVDPTAAASRRDPFLAAVALRSDDPAVAIERASRSASSRSSIATGLRPRRPSRRSSPATPTTPRGGSASAAPSPGRPGHRDAPSAATPAARSPISSKPSPASTTRSPTATIRSRRCAAPGPSSAWPRCSAPAPPQRADTLEAAAVAYYRSTGAAAYADEIATFGR